MSFITVKARTFYNTGCVKCNTFESEMIKIGNVPFCNSCYFLEFGNNIEILSSNEKYQKWHKKYKINL